MAVPSRQLFIVGQWAPPARGGELEVFNPSTGGVIGRIPAGTAEDVNRAVQEATLAFAGAWSKTTGKQRAEVLKRIAEMVSGAPRPSRWPAFAGASA